MNEIMRISEAIAKVDRQAFAVVSVAAFAGLRMSEIRGLRWSDYDSQSLSVARSVWRTHVGPTKALGSEGTVPVLPLLKKILDDNRATVAGQDNGYMFAGERRGVPRVPP
jgi:integrase